MARELPDKIDAHQMEPQTIFPDPIAMKNKMKEQMMQKEYDVSEFYKKEGAAQFIARHPGFEKLTLIVIAFNALWISVDTDWNKSVTLLEARPIFQIAEQGFCIYFAFEWTIRFAAFDIKWKCVQDAWFVFDSLLVGMMVMETWIMSAVLLALGEGSSSNVGLGNASILRMARLMRLTRMARMARLLRAMPELLILIKGMAAAMRSVMFTLGLLTVILYIFAIAFTQLCEKLPCEAEFSSVPHSMHYLLVKGALMDSVGEVANLLESQSHFLLFVWYVFLLLASLTVMNMLIGVICEVVSAVATCEKEAISFGFVAERIRVLVHSADNDDGGDEMISRKELLQMLDEKKALSILHDVGVEPTDLVDLADQIFEDVNGKERQLNYDEFMDLVLSLRGTNNATVKDMMNLRKYLKLQLSSMEHRLDKGSRSNSNSNLKVPLDAFSEDRCTLITNVSEPASGNSSLRLRPTCPHTGVPVQQQWQHQQQQQEQEAQSRPLSGDGSIPGIALAAARLDSSLKEFITSYKHEIFGLRADNNRLQAELQQLKKVLESTTLRSTAWGSETSAAPQGCVALVESEPVVQQMTQDVHIKTHDSPQNGNGFAPTQVRCMDGTLVHNELVPHGKLPTGNTGNSIAVSKPCKLLHPSMPHLSMPQIPLPIDEAPERLEEERQQRQDLQRAWRPQPEVFHGQHPRKVGSSPRVVPVSMAGPYTGAAHAAAHASCSGKGTVPHIAAAGCGRLPAGVPQPAHGSGGVLNAGPSATYAL